MDDIKLKKEQREINADNKIADGDSPETFLKNYTLDTKTRDVICFRKPHIRDLQIGDFIKTDDGNQGFVIQLTSKFLHTIRFKENISKSLYESNFSRDYRCQYVRFDNTDINQCVDYKVVTDKSCIQDFHYEIIVAIVSDDKFKKLKKGEAIQSFQIGKYTVNDIVEIYKNPNDINF